MAGIILTNCRFISEQYSNVFRWHPVRAGCDLPGALWTTDYKKFKYPILNIQKYIRDVYAWLFSYQVKNNQGKASHRWNLRQVIDYYKFVYFGYQSLSIFELIRYINNWFFNSSFDPQGIGWIRGAGYIGYVCEILDWYLILMR